MVKLLGAVMIIVASTSYGFQRAKGYRQRTIDLRLFQDALSMLQTEVTYGLTPLPLAMEKISRLVNGIVKDFFMGTLTDLKRGEGDLLEIYWNKNLDLLTCGLKDEDKEILRNLGYTLGKSSVAEQKKHIDITLRQLKMAERESKELCSKNEKMWKYLGFFAGLALILVLI